MPLGADLKKAFDVSNLRRAARWILASSDVTYREYRQGALTELSSYPARLWTVLSDRLSRGIYEPSGARRVQLPKQSHAARTYTLPCVQDEIVYQALANVVAERLYPDIKSNYLSSVFGNLYAGKSSRTFYRDWRMCRRLYIRRARQSVEQVCSTLQHLI